MSTLPVPCRERGIQSSDAIEPGDAHVNALKRSPRTSHYRSLEDCKRAGRTPEAFYMENMHQMQYAALTQHHRDSGLDTGASGASPILNERAASGVL